MKTIKCRILNIEYTNYITFNKVMLLGTVIIPTKPIQSTDIVIDKLSYNCEYFCHFLV